MGNDFISKISLKNQTDYSQVHDYVNDLDKRLDEEIPMHMWHTRMDDNLYYLHRQLDDSKYK